MPDYRVLAFTAPWCAPCQCLHETWRQIRQFAPVELIDVDATPETAETYGVQGLPTAIVLRDGEVADYIGPVDVVRPSFLMRVLDTVAYGGAR